MTNRALTVVAAVAFVVGLAGSAGAQSTTPRFELGLGYQLVRAGEVCGDVTLVGGQVVQTCNPDRVFPIGFAGDFARNFGPLGVVGELGWSRDSDEDVSFSAWHIAGGLRWTVRANPRIWPYGQILAGPVFNRVSDDVTNFSGTDTQFMLQPGGGVNFAVEDRWGVFGQIDYRHLFLDKEENLASGRNDIRVFLGIRMLLG